MKAFWGMAVALVLALAGCAKPLAVTVYPGSLKPAMIQKASAAFEDRRFRRSDGAVRQYFYLDTAGTDDVMVYLHGNGSTAAGLTAGFAKAGLDFDIALLEYTGYGANKGTPSDTELLADAKGLLDEMARQKPQARRILVGTSLGGALAVLTAGQREVDGLLTFAAFTQTTQLAPRWARRILATDHKFDALGGAARVKAPWVIVHCTQDKVIPAAMAADLFAARQNAGTTAAAQTKLRIETCPDHEVPFAYWQAALDDLRGLMPPDPQEQEDPPAE